VKEGGCDERFNNNIPYNRVCRYMQILQLYTYDDSLQIRWTNIVQGIGLKKYEGFLIFIRIDLYYGFIHLI
jgi:hypothetical protein